MKKLIVFLTIFCALRITHAQTATPTYDPFKHSENAMHVLTGWGVGSMVVGAGMLFVPNPQVKYAGVQNMAWGAIDLGIAMWGKSSARKSIGYKPPAQHKKEFRTALWINGLLDIAYIGAGYYLLQHGKNDKLKGTGAGIMVQGGFLFVFDWINFALTF